MTPLKYLFQKSGPVTILPLPRHVIVQKIRIIESVVFEKKRQLIKQHLNEADFIGPCSTKVEGPKFGRHPVLADTSTVTHYNVYFISEDVNLPC